MLKKNEAEILGLEAKPNERNRSNARYRITKKQWNKVLGYRDEQDIIDKCTNNYNKAKSNIKKENKDTPFVLSAWNNKGYMMDIDEYCEHYKLPRNDVKSYKLVSHTGTPFYNILFKENSVFGDDFDYIGELEKKI